MVISKKVSLAKKKKLVIIVRKAEVEFNFETIFPALKSLSYWKLLPLQSCQKVDVELWYYFEL
jgi:hypothetical protein